MWRCLLCFFLLPAFFSGMSYGQEHTHLKPGTDTAAINRLLDKGDKTQNPDSAIILFNRAFQLSADANYADGAFRALITKSMKFHEKADFAGERNCCSQALPWAERSGVKDAVAWCYNAFGGSYFSEGDYAQASTYYFKALDDLKKKNVSPTHTTANVYNNLGILNIRLGLQDKALAYFRQGEDVSRKWHLDYQLANSLNNIGEFYNGIHRPDSAIKYFNELMEIGKKLGKTDLVVVANEDIAESLIESGRYKEAIPLLQQAISLGRDHFPYLVVTSSCLLGQALCHVGKYKEAETILTEGLKETKTYNFKDIYEAFYTNLITVYRTTGQLQKALDYTDSLMEIRVALTNSESINAINQMEVKYKTAEKDKQLAQSELLIAQQKNKIINKNIWIAAIAGGVFLLFIILAGLYRNVQNKQRLQAEQIKSLQQENTIGLLKGIVQGEENERGRIASELHDGVGGMLSAIMMRLMSIRHEKEDITSVPSYEEAMQLLTEMGDEIRITAHNLMPEVLLKQSLPTAIRTYCNYLREHNTLEIDFQSYGSFDGLTKNEKLNIYRIIQELLKNTIQHANATHVLVQLVVNEQQLTITVEDNGKGFNTQDTKKGIGLHNLETRVLSMQGHFTVESEINKGTSVYIEFDPENDAS